MGCVQRGVLEGSPRESYGLQIAASRDHISGIAFRCGSETNVIKGLNVGGAVAGGRDTGADGEAARQLMLPLRGGGIREPSPDVAKALLSERETGDGSRGRGRWNMLFNSGAYCRALRPFGFP